MIPGFMFFSQTCIQNLKDGIKKCRAISFIEINGSCYQFMVDDKRHGASTSIYSMLDQMMDHLKSVGYPCKYSDIEEL